MRGVAIGVYCFGLTAGLMAFGAAPRDACYRLFLVMALACALAAWFCPTRDLLQKRFLPLLLVGAVILAQIPLRPPVERYGYVFLALGWMALTFTLLVARQPRFAQFLFLFLMALGLLDAFFGLMQALGGMDFATTDYDRPAAAMATGTFANRNHFAGLLNMTIPIALGGLWATFPRRGGKLRSEGYAWAWIILLVTSFMGLAILLSWSRGGTLSLAAGLIFLAFLILMRRRAREEGATRLSAGAIFVLLLATTVLGAWVGIDQLLDRFGRTEDDAISRVLVYRDSIRLIADYPLGVGPKMYQYYFRPPVDISQDCRWTHAHNDYLETAVEWGIPVALLFWGFIAWRLWKAGSVFLGGKRDEENSPGTASSLWREGMALGCAGAVFSILLHSLVDFNLQIPVNWVVFCMILGLAWRLHGAEVSSVGRGSLVFAVIFTLTLAWSAFPVFKEAVAIQIADSETIPAFEEALTWVPDQPAFHFAVGLLYRDDVDHQDLDKAGQHLEAAVRLNPREWVYWQELGRYYEFTGASEKAEKAMLTCLEIMPFYASERWRLGNFYLREGRVREAVPQIGRALELNPGYREAALVLFWKAGLMGPELDEIWPEDKESELLLARFLVEREAPAADIERQWRRVMQAAGPEGVRYREASFYLDYLSRRRAYDELREAWITIQRNEGVSDADFECGNNLVWNGHFQLPLTGGILDWRIPKSSAYEARVSDGALEIEFKGTENVRLGIEQRVIVPSAGQYVLLVKARSEEISTEQGPYFQVVDTVSGKVLGRMEQLSGSRPWSKDRLQFQVPDGCRAVSVQVRRNPSKRIDNKIRGKVWIANIALSALSGSEILASSAGKQ